MLQINLLGHHYMAFISTLPPFFDFNMFVLNFSKREVLSWLVVPLFLRGQRYSHTEISENYSEWLKPVKSAIPSQSIAWLLLWGQYGLWVVHIGICEQMSRSPSSELTCSCSCMCRDDTGISMFSLVLCSRYLPKPLAVTSYAHLSYNTSLSFHKSHFSPKFCVLFDCKLLWSATNFCTWNRVPYFLFLFFTFNVKTEDDTK